MSDPENIVAAYAALTPDEKAHFLRSAGFLITAEDIQTGFIEMAKHINELRKYHVAVFCAFVDFLAEKGVIDPIEATKEIDRRMTRNMAYLDQKAQAVQDKMSAEAMADIEKKSPALARLMKMLRESGG